MRSSEQSDGRWAALDEVTDAVDSLTEVLDQDDAHVVVHRVCAQVTRVVPGVDAASVSVFDGNAFETVAATIDEIVALDQAQYRAGEGPCLQAANAGALVRAPLAEIERHWPALVPAVLAAGVGSVMSVPLAVGDQRRAAINCYASGHHGFAELDVQLLEVYASAVEAALRAYYNYLAARELAEQLRAAMISRSVIDQAKGILMAAHGLDEQAAFNRLTEQSQQHNIKLRDLAAQFVAEASGNPVHPHQ